MSVTKTHIANRALQKLGAARLTSYDEDSTAGRAIRAAYDLARDDVLRAHPWNFAIKRTNLQLLSETPAFGYDNAFGLPTDFLRAVQIGDTYVAAAQGRATEMAAFQIEGRKVLSNEGGPLPFRYVYRVTDEDLFDPAFVEALACRLAAELGEEITNSTTKAEAQSMAYERALRRAKQLDAIENPPEAMQDGSWITARQ